MVKSYVIVLETEIYQKAISYYLENQEEKGGEICKNSVLQPVRRAVIDEAITNVFSAYQTVPISLLGVPT